MSSFMFLFYLKFLSLFTWLLQLIGFFCRLSDDICCICLLLSLYVFWEAGRGRPQCQNDQNGSFYKHVLMTTSLLQYQLPKNISKMAKAMTQWTRQQMLNFISKVACTFPGAKAFNTFYKYNERNFWQWSSSLSFFYSL